MFRNWLGDGVGGLLVTTAKAGVVIAALSVLAGNYVAKDVQSGIAAGERERLARMARSANNDPLVTGSIRSLDASRIDPCNAR